MKKLVSFVALLGSSATLVCCVLPALFVALGFGATFAGLIGAFPQITWLSEHKVLVFGGAAILIAISGIFQWRSKTVSCPSDPKLAAACQDTRGVSRWLFIVSVILYLVGALFAFGLPLLLS